MPRHWEKAQGRGGRAAPAAPAESSNDATVLTTFLEYMEVRVILVSECVPYTTQVTTHTGPIL